MICQPFFVILRFSVPFYLNISSVIVPPFRRNSGILASVAYTDIVLPPPYSLPEAASIQADPIGRYTLRSRHPAS